MATQQSATDTSTSAKTATQSNSSGRRKVRVLIEGREVPCIQALTVFKMNMPSMANIELVPLAVIKFIKPRSQVHVFVRDTLTFGNDLFHLCFEGEVMGRSMAKHQNGRAFRITAYDYTNYWDDTKAFVMNPNFLAGRMADNVMYGEPTPKEQADANAGKQIGTVSNTNSLMIDYLLKFKDKVVGADGKVSSEPDIIKGVMEIARQLALVNEFYRSAYERLRVLDRMDMRSSGRLQQFLASLKVHEFLTSYTGQQGGMISLRQMLMGILALFFHESVTVPFPSLVDKTGGNKKVIKQFLFIPDLYLVPPPVCNVVFPSQQLGFDFDEDFKSAPTRYGFRNSFPLCADDASTLMTYPIQYFPPSFQDYMAHSKTATPTDLNSMLGPSKLVTNTGGASYASLYYSSKSKGKAVGTSYSTTLRESDYMSNEESIKGIFYDSDVLPPAYSSLVRTGATNKVAVTGREVDVATQTPVSRNHFMREIGAYLFFKKRYSARQVTASLMFNPFLVPGFNALFLDSGEAGQSFIAKLQSITHNMTNTGFTTTVELAYGRDFDEIDIVSGGTGDPKLPEWFGPDYGATDVKNKYFNMETDFLIQKSVFQKDSEEAKYRRTQVTNPTVFTNVSSVYNQLLGCDAITGLGPAQTDGKTARQAVVTTRGAVQFLIAEYLKKEKQGAQDEFVRQYIQRPVTTMEEALFFVGAETPEQASGKQVPEEFAIFRAITDPKRTGLPGRFDGTNYSDGTVLKVRRSVIDSYIEQLKTNGNEGGGFRG